MIRYYMLGEMPTVEIQNGDITANIMPTDAKEITAEQYAELLAQFNQKTKDNRAKTHEALAEIAKKRQALKARIAEKLGMKEGDLDIL